MKFVSAKEQITEKELAEMAIHFFGDLVKAVVDIENRLMVVDVQLHADAEAILLQEGSIQKNLWGINLYPGISGNDFIEFDSMINVRPAQNNRSRGVEDEQIQKIIRTIVAELLCP